MRSLWKCSGRGQGDRLHRCLLLGLLLGLGSVAAAEPLKSPKKGEIKSIPFRPANNASSLPPTVAAEPLKITHHQPEGAEQQPPAISVTFNQPMVPVTSVGNLTGPAPIRVEPEVPGQWKWQVTTTLQLMPKERIRFGTRYKVTVPAKLKAASGQTLGQDFVYSFESPLPAVTQAQPSSGSTEVGLEPLLQIWFNQNVSSEKIGPLVRLLGADNRAIPLTPLPRSGWAKDARLSGYAQQPMMTAFAPAHALKPNTTYRIQVSPGVVGDEGPLPGTQRFESTFTTYPPFAVKALRCGDCNSWSDDSAKTCTVGSNLCVTFNHEIAVPKVESFVSVAPAPKGLKMLVNYSQIQLSGKYEANQNYKITVAPGLRDSFKQALASAWSREVRYEHLPTSITPLVQSEAVIEKSGSLALPVQLVNADTIEVEAYRLNDTQLNAGIYAAQHSIESETFKSSMLPLKTAKVASWIERPKLPKDKPDLYNIPLRQLVQQHGAGTYLLTVGRAGRPVLVQLTDLGITARYDSDKMVVFVTSIATGRPVAGVSVQVMGEGEKLQPAAKTGADGVAVLKAVPLGKDESLGEIFVLAAAGSDRSYLRARSYGDDGRSLSFNWGRAELPAYARTMFYPDRDLYRPGETVHIFGIDRRFEGGLVDKLGVPTDRKELTWAAYSSRSRELAKGSAKPTLFGTFDFSFQLPAQIDLGAVSIQTPLGSTSINVQEYRAPEFEVSVKTSPGAIFYGDTIRGTVSGRYLFGAPMKKADVRWTLYSDEQRFSAPNLSEFHFGSEPPRWYHEERYHRGYERGGPLAVAQGQGKLDDQGRLALQIPFGIGEAQLDPAALILEATVTDVSRQSSSGRSDLRAHPADRYIGMRVAAIAEENRPAAIELVVVDVEGRRAPGVSVTLKATGQFSEQLPDADEDGNATTKTVPKPVEVKPCVVTSAEATQTCALLFPKGGGYLLEASARDSKGRPVTTRLHVEVAGKDSVPRDTKAGRVELRFDRAEYKAGQTAVLTVRAPFPEGVALITEERRGLVGHQVIRIGNYQGTARIAVREEHIPNLEISATAIRGRGKERPRAAWAVGSGRLNIALESKRLNVELRPQKTIARPGEKVAVYVVVTDAQHRPVRAQVSLVAVDEAVLGMTGFATPNPLPFFHYVREAGVALAEILKSLLPEEGRKAEERSAEEEKMKKAEAPASRRMASDDAAEVSAAGPSGGRSGLAAVVRRLFLTTPGATVLQTSDAGSARFVLPLPDNLTRFRIMAVAADERDRFGAREAGITTQKPLQLRASLPRFVNTNDAFLAGVVIDNQLQQAGTAEVSLAASGVELIDAPLQRVALAAGEAKELTWAVKAPKPGSANFRFSVQLGPESDAVESTLPIFLPPSAESFATYGTSTSSVTQPVQIPKDVMAGFGGLAVTIGASAMNGLQDAARYLIEYPYGCAEQVSSKAMPILVLGEIVEQYKLGGVETLALGRRHAQIAVDKLVAGQRSDGSWGTWMAPSETPRADLTAYIMLVLKRAKELNLNVPDDTSSRGSQYLQQWLGQNLEAKAADGRSRRWMLDVQALALFALSDWGKPNDAAARSLYGSQSELDLFARGMLAAVFHRMSPQSPERLALLREILSRVIQTASSARFQESQSEELQLLMHSSSRTDAILLLVLLELDPQNELIPKVVRGLMDARINGRWETTQANSYAVWALARYFKVYEAAPTAFTAQMFLGKTKVGESRFAEKSLREELLEVPMAFLQQNDPRALTIAKSGTGRFYYRVGLKYAPQGSQLAALEQGFTVTRKYESGTGEKDDVRRSADGSWQIKAGAYVRVSLRVVVQDRRFYVVVDDALPAGLELVNSAYKTAARTPSARDPDEEWWGGYASWQFNHRELRDERSLHFADELAPGTYQLNVLARATVRGTFVVPPTRAEEMYHPEVFGRAASDRVTIK